jgi:hypothetical protein
MYIEVEDSGGGGSRVEIDDADDADDDDDDDALDFAAMVGVGGSQQKQPACGGASAVKDGLYFLADDIASESDSDDDDALDFSAVIQASISTLSLEVQWNPKTSGGPEAMEIANRGYKLIRPHGNETTKGCATMGSHAKVDSVTDTQQPWFHHGLSRKAAVELLERSGCGDGL